MQLTQRINAFVKLGEFLSQFKTNQPKCLNEKHETYFTGFKHQIKIAYENNGWFTPENIAFSINSWVELLTEDKLSEWLKNYNLETTSNKTIAIVMAGNIPLVGFHDFLSVLISGHSVVVKQSSNDKHLLPFLAKYLEVIEPLFKGKISFISEKLENFDAVIATGSNNTARYFEYYFKNKPNLIRKNRTSVAILNGNETLDNLELLSDDIFRYYGLGCRNVAKIFVPKAYSFDDFFKSIYKWHPIINQSKYANNYDYNKAVYLMSEFDMLENGFLMLKEDESYSSPIATLFYETYQSTEELQNKLNADKDKIQCVVSNGMYPKSVSFGNTQKPKLWEYADNVDTIEFLLNI